MTSRPESPPPPAHRGHMSAGDKQTHQRRQKSGFTSIFISFFSVRWQVVFLWHNVETFRSIQEKNKPGGGVSDGGALGPRKQTSGELILEHLFESVSESLRRKKQQVVMGGDSSQWGRCYIYSLHNYEVGRSHRRGRC